MQSVASLRSGDGQQRAREHGEARQACAVAPCEREGRAEQLARCGAAVVRGASREFGVSKSRPSGGTTARPASSDLPIRIVSRTQRLSDHCRSDRNGFWQAWQDGGRRLCLRAEGAHDRETCGPWVRIAFSPPVYGRLDPAPAAARMRPTPVARAAARTARSQP